MPPHSIRCHSNTQHQCCTWSASTFEYQLPDGKDTTWGEAHLFRSSSRSAHHTHHSNMTTKNSCGLEGPNSKMWVFRHYKKLFKTVLQQCKQQQQQHKGSSTNYLYYCPMPWSRSNRNKHTHIVTSYNVQPVNLTETMVMTTLGISMSMLSPESLIYCTSILVTRQCDIKTCCIYPNKCPRGIAFFKRGTSITGYFAYTKFLPYKNFFRSCAK